jgi:hypothetical protein
MDVDDTCALGGRSQLRPSNAVHRPRLGPDASFSAKADIHHSQRRAHSVSPKTSPPEADCGPVDRHDRIGGLDIDAAAVLRASAFGARQTESRALAPIQLGGSGAVTLNSSLNAQSQDDGMIVLWATLLLRSSI